MKQALRMTLRDWRAGELRFLLVALVVAVAALAAVGFFVDRMRSGLERDAHQIMGADLLINSLEPAPQAWRDEARRRGLLLAEGVNFPSMASTGEGDASRSQLVMIKAMSEHFPLRGHMKLSTDRVQAADGIGQEVDFAPAPGTVWVDPAVLTNLNAEVGATLECGKCGFLQSCKSNKCAGLL